LTPQRELFEFARVANVSVGEARTVVFAVSASTLAQADEGSGDVVARAGAFELLFDTGSGFIKGKVGQAARASGGLLAWNTTLVGSDVVVAPFPSQHALES
jgi:hypothetical protein